MLPPPTSRLRLVALCVLFCFQTLAAHAWHDLGHEVVAEIAWKRMTPQARAAAMVLLQQAPADSGLAALRPATGSAAEQDRTQFVRAATWADAVRTGARRKKYHQALWHFTDFYWEQPTPDATPQPRPDIQPHGELVVRLPALEASLRQPATTPPVSPSKSTDLAWFLHLMGDIAQPLHCSGRITPTEMEGDEGGNLFLLSSQPPPTSGSSGNRRPMNLHFFWDHVIEREYGEDADIARVAAQIEAQHPPAAQSQDLALGQYETWARASQQIALAVAYPPTLARNVEPSPAYRAQVKQVSERALALAGERLGATLNQVFAAPPAH
ncbi:MAG: S1/P1 nuclease [Verrucomicrobia bacterium]|nr:S1/P1 nuclease [Verrucomicrobiota bacterium]